MHVLHLCSDYAKQRLYPQLFSELDDRNIFQTVYVPVRSHAELGVPRMKKTAHTTVYLSKVLQKHHRYLYWQKKARIFADVIDKCRIENVSLIHAHFLFSDGGVAYELFRRFGIPYCVAIRNTDINAFFKYAWHLRHFGAEILRHASRVVFIAPAYQGQLARYLSPADFEGVKQKSVVIPNAIPAHWFAAEPGPKLPSDTLRLLYLGEFSKNKNIHGTIAAVRQLIAEGRSVHLTLVGNYGDYCEKIRALQAKNAAFVEIRDAIRDPHAVQALFKAADIFVMPSFSETFGLVYIEALSQGVPIVYSEGQGVDGYFDSVMVGEKVNPSNPSRIAHGIKKIADQLATYSKNAYPASQLFNWNSVVDRYVGLYDEVLQRS